LLTCVNPCWLQSLERPCPRRSSGVSQRTHAHSLVNALTRLGRVCRLLGAPRRNLPFSWYAALAFLSGLRSGPFSLPVAANANVVFATLPKDAYYGKNTKIADTLNNLLLKSPQNWQTTVGEHRFRKRLVHPCARPVRSSPFVCSQACPSFASSQLSLSVSRIPRSNQTTPRHQSVAEHRLVVEQGTR
jgi:hypothetical protein